MGGCWGMQAHSEVLSWVLQLVCSSSMMWGALDAGEQCRHHHQGRPRGRARGNDVVTRGEGG